MAMQPADAVLKFLASVGRSSEAQFYLQLFRAEPKERFATIAVDATTLEQGLDAVVVDLRFLGALELTPIVVLGLHQPARTPHNASQLESRLREAGVAATRVSAQAADGIAEAVRGAAREARLPIVTFHEASEAGRIAELESMLAALGTRKLIFLRREGGLELPSGLVSLVNLSRDYERLHNSPDISDEQRQIVELSRQLVFGVPHRMVVSLTSPFSLLHELFTLRGAGTLLRRGARIAHHRGLDEIDRTRLRQLIESGFERPLVGDFMERPVSSLYLEENYRGAALVVDTDLGGYLTKVAVTREAQGEGVGRDLWDRLCEDYPTLIWRARRGNPATGWYDTLCDGLVRQDSWTVYFRGLAAQRIPAAIAYALAQPVDFATR